MAVASPWPRLGMARISSADASASAPSASARSLGGVRNSDLQNAVHLRNGGGAGTSSEAPLWRQGATPAAIFGARFLPPTLKLEVHCAARCALLLRCARAPEEEARSPSRRRRAELEGIVVGGATVGRRGWAAGRVPRPGGRCGLARWAGCARTPAAAAAPPAIFEQRPAFDWRFDFGNRHI